MRVLVVEDFEPTARAIVTGLRREGMAVDVAYDGDEALGQLALTRYDVVVLDRDLPGVHGDEICRRLAAGRSPTRILMLTAAGQPVSTAQALQRLMLADAIGRQLPITVVRNGALVDLNAREVD